MNSAFARQWKRVCELDADAREMWRKVDRAKKKAVKLAKLGGNFIERRVPISKDRTVKIVNCARKLQRKGLLFTKAYAHQYEMEEVKR